MLSSDGQQFPQYQHNEQLPLILNELTEHTRKTTSHGDVNDRNIHIIWNKIVNIKFIANVEFLEFFSSGTLNIDILENQIIVKWSTISPISTQRTIVTHLK
jgi:hypothetical protein